MTRTTHFMFFLLRDFSHLAFSCALEPLRIANLVSGKPLYRWTLASEDGKTAIMKDSIEEPVPAGLIAERLGISTRQPERLFGRYLNATPKHYFNEMRLNRARNLLVQTEQSVTEIAMACGFQSTSHFSRAFRSHFGRSPVAQRTLLA